MAIFSCFLALTNAYAHHDPRHENDAHTPEIATPELIYPTDENVETENTGQIRHHIYMPLNMAYRQAPPAPIIQYVPVPVYTADPRFISFGVRGHANFGVAR